MNTIEIATRAAARLSELRIKWKLHADHEGEVRLFAAAGGFIPHVISSPTSVGSHSLKLTEIYGNAFEVDSIEVESLVIAASTRVETDTDLFNRNQLAELTTFVDRWTDEVVRIESARQPYKAIVWEVCYSEDMDMFFLQAQGSDVVLGALYSTEQAAKEAAGRLNVREQRKAAREAGASA